MLDEREIKVGSSYVGEFFTGLEMAGFLVTLMKLDDELKLSIDRLKKKFIDRYRKEINNARCG
jgi:dihydroxyacetone kinase